jgi:hypothetical protein
LFVLLFDDYYEFFDDLCMIICDYLSAIPSAVQPEVQVGLQASIPSKLEQQSVNYLN